MRKFILIAAIKHRHNWHLVFDHGFEPVRTYTCCIDADTVEKAQKIAKEHAEKFPTSYMFKCT